MKSEKVEFDNGRGQSLSGRVEKPETPRAYALFAHCFSCSKDVLAAVRISRALCDLGVGVLRFDFTGLGHSEGAFANENFSSNIADLAAAAKFMSADLQSPKIVIGHSLGGAAVIAAAEKIPSARAIATIAAPSDPSHVTHLFACNIGEIEKEGKAKVPIAGRKVTIKKQFIEDIQQHNLKPHLENLGKALLVMHSPVDQTVSIEHARNIFTMAKHPKSFISLDTADHLLTDRGDAEYVANILATWSERYID